MDITYIPFTFPALTQGLRNVHCLFQTRTGGLCSGAHGGGNISFATTQTAKNTRASITANRYNLHKTVNCPMSELAQVHGDTIIFEPKATTHDTLLNIEADGQATSRTEHALMIKTADCQPILFTHIDGTHIMALHVGWRGNRINFIGSAIARFCSRYNLHPQELLAVRGPSLGLAEFINFNLEWGDNFKQWFDTNTQSMNLWALTRHQLQHAGILPQHIFSLDLCTATLNELFFSHRKDKNTGRQASIIWIKNS